MGLFSVSYEFNRFFIAGKIFTKYDAISKSLSWSHPQTWPLLVSHSIGAFYSSIYVHKNADIQI